MITVKINYSLKSHNTFGMDVLCRRWIEYDSASDLPDIFRSDFPGPYKSIGEGSNMLFSHNYPGSILHNNITDTRLIMQPGDSVIVRAGAGVKMDDLVQLTIKRGFWGIENLSGIPGTAGAAAVQNIGAYGVELSDAVHSVEVFDTFDSSFVTFTNDECDYAYRKSRFKCAEKDRYIVAYVNLLLSRTAHPRLDYAHLKSQVADCRSQAEIRRAVINMRDSKLPDPRSHGNAGSFFMNPVVSHEKYAQLCSMHPGEDVPRYDAATGVKVPAAWLIDKAGWRGRSVGGAAVWSRQPLVLVNTDGKASAEDIIRLKDAIIQDINNKYGIILTPEVEIL